MEGSKDLPPDEPDCIRLRAQQQVIQLWSYQYGLRLRHLTQVVGRNLQGHGSHPRPVPACPLPSKNPRSPANMGYYFTLHASSNKEEIFSSELESTTNPNWLEMEPESIKTIHQRSLKGALIRLWFKPEGDNAQLVTTWGVHFSGLVPIGSVLPYDHEMYKPNTLVFKLRHIFYTAPGNYQDAHLEKSPPRLRYGFVLPLSETKRCYTVSALSRLHSTKRAQRQQEIKCEDTRDDLERQGLTRTSCSELLATKVEDCRVKVALLREQLEAEIDQLRALKLSADSLDNQNQEKGIELLGGYQDLHRQLVKVRGLQETANTDSEKLRDACVYLSDWRKQLISQLPIIYPITQDGEGKVHICGVHLPDAENYDGFNDISLSVALGFVSHLIVLISQLLHLPLRYPVKPNGSFSTITDTTSVQLRDTEREFPLYTRGKDRERLHFNYGVFLLNKNIAQTRWYCGIPTPDLRPTLPNLSVLMSKLIQNGTMGNQPAALMPDVLMPVPASTAPLNLEVRTPASLLQQQRSPRLPLNPLGRTTSQEHSKGFIDNYEDDDCTSQWKFTKSGSETNSSDVSPVKASLYVREAEPLNDKDSTGKFVFVDKVQHPLVDTTQMEQHLEERLSHSNGFSFSLDNGLNHIGGKHNQYYKIQNLSCCDDLKLMNNVSKALGFVRGSDPSLLANSDLAVAGEGEEEILPVFKEQTTELLRSWHEDEPSHYTGVVEAGSSEKLEEVGVECDESFMCSADKRKALPQRTNSEQTEENNEITLREVVKAEGMEQHLSSNIEAEKSDEKIKSEKSVSGNEIEDDLDNLKSGKDGVLSLSEFGVTEDMFLSDVALRTAALARQNCSFKMSFSRQSTEDEYH
nr:UV radiation resistance-associated protein-like [Procambarus clarkii]XP_045582709.1 UV radiation resistance-associated protein-like [Procambarus clarkii]